jgi:hypothetical protein
MRARFQKQDRVFDLILTRSGSRQEMGQAAQDTFKGANLDLPARRIRRRIQTGTDITHSHCTA